MIEITRDPIPVAHLIEQTLDDACGATVAFVGTTRRWTDGVETAYLEYEAYEEMAAAQMNALADEAHSKWPIRRLCLVHRIGKVEIKEASVAVVVSTPHRADAFEAGRWLIDELKKRVPIWKKEWFHASGPLSKQSADIQSLPAPTTGHSKWIHPRPAS